MVIRARVAELGGEPASKPWILAATILGSSIAFIDSTVVNVALPAIQGNFHTTVVDVQWVVEAYGLFLAALILVGGSLGDQVGRRRVFLLGVTVFAVASLFCGLASSIRQLILARSVQGMGAALLVPGSLAIISASFDEDSRGSAIGTWSGFTAITTAIGPVLGGWLVEHASWRWAFFINLPLAAMVIAISLRHVPESCAPRSRKIDWPGALLVTAGLGGLVAGFVESAEFGWRHPLVFGSLLAGALSLIAFVLYESRATSPMVPLHMFHSTTFSSVNLLTFFLYSAIGIFFFLFPLNLIQVQGYTATAAGAATLPLVLLMFALSRWAGGLVSRYGARLPLIVGPTVAAAGFLLFAAPSIGGSYWKSFLPPVIVLGLGMATTVAPLTTVVMNSAATERAGAASGINNAVARVAGVVAIAVLGAVMVYAFGHKLHHQLGKLSLSPKVLHSIEAESTKLGGLAAPSGVEQAARSSIKREVGKAFVHGFRIVMLICAALSLISAMVSALAIPRTSVSGSDTNPPPQPVRK